MSIAVHDGYRVSQAEFSSALKIIHDLMLDISAEKIHKWLEEVEPAFIRRALDFPREAPVTIKHKIEFAYSALKSLYREHKDDMFGCGLNVWFHNDAKVYIILWGADNAVTSALEHSEKLKKLSSFEEYSYWDNSDPPSWALDGEGYKAFTARRKVWIVAGPASLHPARNRCHLQHEVVTASKFDGLEHLFYIYRQKYSSSA